MYSVRSQNHRNTERMNVGGGTARRSVTRGWTTKCIQCIRMRNFYYNLNKLNQFQMKVKFKHIACLTLVCHCLSFWLRQRYQSVWVCVCWLLIQVNWIPHRLNEECRINCQWFVHLHNSLVTDFEWNEITSQCDTNATDQRMPFPLKFHNISVFPIFIYVIPCNNH